MLWLALCALLLGLVALLLYLLPISINSNLQLRAEPSGSWALALGIGIGPLALSGIAAHGVKPFLACHLFGRQLVRVPLARWLNPLPPKKPAPAELKPSTKSEHGSRAERWLARSLRNLDPVDTVLAWWATERVFEVKELVVDVEYSFSDIALTGQILAGLYMLSGVLPERFVINQTPAWEFEDRLALEADGRFRIWPVRLVVDVLGFVLKQNAQARRTAVPVSH